MIIWWHGWTVASSDPWRRSEQKPAYGDTGVVLSRKAFHMPKPAVETSEPCPVAADEPRGPWARYWIRHRHPLNRALHMVGVPLLAAACLLALVQLVQWRWDLWWRPVILLIVSYLLQWVGHRIEGNDMGEVVFIKKRLGRPYVAVAPQDRTTQ